MTATASDYTWFRSAFPGLAEAYCLTLVRDVDPIDLIHRARGRVRGRATGVADLFQAADDMSYPGQWFVAVTRVGAWTLAVEPNGALGVNERAATRMSRGTSLVTHYWNMNADNHFYWIDDGATRLSFEPGSPLRRMGSDADALINVLREIGFDLDPEAMNFHIAKEASLALAEYLTGVVLTPEVLGSASFICGTAPTSQA